MCDFATKPTHANITPSRHYWHQTTIKDHQLISMAHFVCCSVSSVTLIHRHDPRHRGRAFASLCSFEPVEVAHQSATRGFPHRALPSRAVFD